MKKVKAATNKTTDKLKTASNNSGNSGRPGSAQKKKMVPSRYMQSATLHTKTNQSFNVSTKNTSGLESLDQSNRRMPKPAPSLLSGENKLARSGSIRGTYITKQKKASNTAKVKPSSSHGPKKAFAAADSFVRLESPPTLMQDGNNSGSSSHKASTPTYGHQVSLSQSIDASAIHSESTLALSSMSVLADAEKHELRLKG